MHNMASQSKPQMSMTGVPIDYPSYSHDAPRRNPSLSEYELLSRPQDGGPTVVGGAPYPPSSHGRRSCCSAWTLEALSIFGSICCMVGVIAILALMKDQPLTNWTIPINLNSTIAILITALKSWAMLAVASCISQNKWMFFRKKRAQLKKLDVFDEASRGPLGSFRLMFSLGGRFDIALIGAFITIVVLGVDAFAQQVLTFDSRIDPVDNNGTAHFMVSNMYDGGAKAPGAVMTHTAPEASTIDTAMQGAIYRGLYSSESSSPFACSSQCVWPTTYRSLGFASQCEDVTTQTMANLTHATNGSHTQSMTTPGGVKLNYLVSPTSFYPVVVVGAKDLISEASKGARKEIYMPEFVRVGILRLRNSSMEESNFWYLGANVSEVIECTVRFTAYDYSNISTAGSKLAVGKTTPVPLGEGSIIAKERDDNRYFAGFNQASDPAFNKTGTGGTPQFKIGTLDMGALSGFFTSNRFSGSMFDGESPPKDAGGMGQAFLKGNIPGVFANMTQSMTDHLRSGYSNVENVKGQTLVSVTIVRVHWVWLALPVGVLALATLFLIITIWDSWGSRGQLWKSSVVAALYHKVAYGDQSGSGVLYTDLQSVKQLDELARGTSLTYP
ncbi:hypothetical protein PG995_003138 [Apiospora arundinis]